MMGNHRQHEEHRPLASHREMREEESAGVLQEDSEDSLVGAIHSPRARDGTVDATEDVSEGPLIA
jgi:hypothetical protein